VPIYEYRCTQCGHQQDHLQKVSDPVLANCPACGQATYTKQVTAAGFQLKGSGWYATDFKGGAKQPAAKDDTKTESKVDAKSDAKSETKTDAKSGGKADGKSESKSESKSERKSESKSEKKATAPASGGS
jgi:putative FmdB family regulatory protein